jgi:hypothetical protein
MKRNLKQSETKLKNIQELDENNFEDVILEISLKKPVRAYNYYLNEMRSTFKEKDLNITSVSHEFGKRWTMLTEKEKQKYLDMEEEDKQRYKEHLAAVKKYILEKPLKESATAMTLYLDEHVKEAIENDKDPREARKEAREKWKLISEKEKNIYEEKKEKHMELYDSLKQARGRISGYILFIKDQLMQAKEKEIRMTIVDCAELWKKAKPSIKEKYMIYADEIREERERMRDLYEITFGIKPKRPLGAYKFFMMEQAKEGKFNGKNAFKEASKLWSALSIENKERYQKIAKKRQLAYVIKKADYLSSVRKLVGKSPSPFNLFVNEMRDKHKENTSTDKMFDLCSEKWEKLDREAKKKYFDLAKEGREKMKEEFLESHDAPKRPIAPYTCYYSEQFPLIQKKNPKMAANEIMKEVAEQWKILSEKEKNKYIESYQTEMIEYRKKVKDFEDNKLVTPAKEKASAKKNKRNTSAARSRKSKVNEKESDQVEERSRSKKGKKSEKKSAKK